MKRFVVGLLLLLGLSAPAYPTDGQITFEGQIVDDQSAAQNVKVVDESTATAPAYTVYDGSRKLATFTTQDAADTYAEQRRQAYLTESP